MRMLGYAPAVPTCSCNSKFLYLLRDAMQLEGPGSGANLRKHLLITATAM